MRMVSELRTYMQVQTGYAHSNYDAVYLRCLNRALEKIYQYNWKFLEKTSTVSITVATGKGPYSLATDFHRMGKVKITSGSTTYELLEGDKEQIDNWTLSATGIPKWYYLDLSSASTSIYYIYFGCPTTDGSYTAKYTYFYKPTAMANDTDYTIIGQQYADADELVMAYTLSEFYKVIQEDELANVWQQKAEQLYLPMAYKTLPVSRF